MARTTNRDVDRFTDMVRLQEHGVTGVEQGDGCLNLRAYGKYGEGVLPFPLIRHQ